MPKFNKIRKGDTVEVLSGKDKGKRGEVLEVLAQSAQVIVAGINVHKKHGDKRRQPNQPGQNAPQIRDIDAPIHLSNVALVDPKTGQSGRVGFREENGAMVRFVKPKREKKY
jgi:large subunit ribosomal protein L24